MLAGGAAGKASIIASADCSVISMALRRTRRSTCSASCSRAIADALAHAGIEPGNVDYVNAHGTGTPANDPAETAALRQIFGEHALRLAVSSTKSMHGHALGASSALELVATVLAIRDGVIPPTANFTEADPDCDLDYVPNSARRRNVGIALSNSFAFGGLNVVLAVRSV